MDIQPPKDRTPTPKAPEEVLNVLIEDLQNLRQNVTERLGQDIERLNTEKQQLKTDIEQLRQQYQKMQSQQLESLSQKQIVQNQIWLKQLAQVLANNLEEQLTQKFDSGRGNWEPSTLGGVPGGELDKTNLTPSYEESSDRFKDSLDVSLQRTLEALQEELNSYQSNLSQQLSNMRSMEQQGEVILEALVSRLRQELEEAAEESPAPTYTEEANLADSEETGEQQETGEQPIPPPPLRAQPQPIAAKPTPAPAKAASQVQLGLIFAVFSAIVLSVFNVSIKIILKGGAPKMVFGMPVEGVITPGFGNSLLILFLRMIVVCLLMPFLAAFLYPAVGNDIARTIKSDDKELWWKVIGSAFFLFLSQVCIYIALGNIATGIAITLFFIYPIATTLGAWQLFGDRPSIIRFGAMGGITLGLILAAAPSFNEKLPFGDPRLGIIAAILAGVTFAGYVLLTQMAAGKLHPIPFSLVNFCAIFVFSAISLILLPFIINLGLLPENFSVSSIEPELRLGLIVGGAILGVLTLFSYLLNNFAIRFAGAALASVIGTLGPALTALFAWIVIKETLLPIQMMGMVVVTLSVIAISLERMFAPKKKAS
ncbi:MAG: EamA family transporter [Cyanobacteriota bacterium]|nr:EamA family transporter [Cyanobacteriota bacterium]